MKKTDGLLLIVVVCLTLFGLLMIYDASSFIAHRDFADKYHYLRVQSLWVVLGFASMMFFSFLDYRRLYTIAIPLLITAIILLFLVFIPGIGVYVLGARRWVNTGFFILQPAEFVKLALAIYLSAWFSSREKGRFMAFLLLMGLVLFLVMLEPDMGTAIIILAEALIVYFLSGGNILSFAFLLPVIAAIGMLVVVFSPYRLKRLATFLNPNESVQHASYHVRQILIALGSGGVMGVGLGNSIQKYAYLPENTTDSIFAIIAEELGFVGSLVLITLLVVVVWRGFLIAGQCKDQFGKLLAGGITSFLAVQVLINLASQTALIPLTGVPLPFISYGGSALLVDLSAIGILLSIAKRV